jgi:hypothetical protein
VPAIYDRGKPVHLDSLPKVRVPFLLPDDVFIDELRGLGLLERVYWQLVVALGYQVNKMTRACIER